LRAAAAVLLAALGACAGGASDRGDFIGRIERRVLPNGMAVVAVQDDRLPTVTAMLAYRVGSVHEPEGLTGVSHYFEHMVFKGTRKYRAGEIDLVTHRCGGENNAYTTHDMTGYWFHVHSAHLDEVLDILADTMGNCTLDPGEFERERGPVLQEMSIWLDSPWGPLERDLEKTVYTKSGYRHPVLGWKEDVERLSRDRMMEYYRTHYAPNQASLVVVGNLPREEVFARAGRRFAGLPAGQPVPEPQWRDAPQTSERRIELQTELPNDRFLLSFRTGPAGGDDDLVLDVISTILGDGRSSRLIARLADEEDLAGQDSVEVFNYSRKYEGTFTVKVELALEGDPVRAREIVVEELDRISREPVTERELRRAKNILRARFAFEGESQYELTSKLGYFEALGLPDYVPRYMDRIEAITADQVRDCAARIFRPEGRNWGIGKAKPGKAGAVPQAAPPKRRPGLRPARQAGYAAPKLGPVAEAILPNGLTLLAHRRKGLPVLSVQALVQAGQAFEPATQAGLAQLVGDLLDEGIDDGQGRTRTAEQIAADVEFVGGRFSTGAAGVAVKVLAEHASTAYDLVRDLLRYPSFPRTRFEALKDDQLAEAESQDEDPSGVARRLFHAEAFRGHPYERPAYGTREALEKLTLKDVKRYHASLFRPSNTIIAVVGDVDPKAALAELTSRLAGWAADPAVPGPPSAPAVLRGVSGKTLNHPFPSQQVRLHLGHAGVDRRHPDWSALRVLETILCSSAGFTNRLAKRVREQNGLAYDVGGTITGGAGVVAGPFEIVLGVEGRDKDRALGLIRAELEAFLKDGPTEEEVLDARRYLLASFSSSWETSDHVAAYLLETRRYGLGPDYAERFHRETAAVTRADVLRTARNVIDLKALVTVVVGPVDKDGKVTEGARDP
jgi:zinc protease